MATVLVPIANGCEEIEAVTIIDVLRRGGIEVIAAGLESGPAKGAHGLLILPETTLDKVHVVDVDMVALPGGGPGTNLLRKSRLLKAIMLCVSEKGGNLAAMCAAPLVLADHGFLDGRKATWYPGIKIDRPGLQHLDQQVVVDGNIVTSQGPGTAMAFALKIVELLEGPEKAREIAGQLLAP